MCSESHPHNHRPHSPATTDTDDEHQGQQHPDGGKFGGAGENSKTTYGDAGRRPDLDFSLSAEVKTGSSSTLESDQLVRPLRFSNSADTDSTARATTSSASPHYVTPTSQRSQPPGNPMLHSSPIGPVVEKMELSRPQVGPPMKKGANDSDKVGRFLPAVLKFLCLFCWFILCVCVCVCVVLLCVCFVCVCVFFFSLWHLLPIFFF
jgi:hypothetical protein